MLSKKYVLVVLLVAMFALAMASTAFAAKVVVAPLAAVDTGRDLVARDAANFLPAGQMAQGNEVKIVSDVITDANFQAVGKTNAADKVIYGASLHTESGQHFKAKYGLDLHRYHEGRATITYKMGDVRTGQISTKTVEASVKPGDQINAECAAGLMAIGGAMASGHLGSGSTVSGAGWVMVAGGYWARTQATPAEMAVSLAGAEIWAQNWLPGIGDWRYLAWPMMAAPLLAADGDPVQLEYAAAVNAAALVN